jgi:hypothetical protein
MPIVRAQPSAGAGNEPPIGDPPVNHPRINNRH